MTRRSTVAEILAHPAYPDAIFQLTPTQSGKLSVAANRTGTFHIDWEVHGEGDVKLVWIMGLGQLKTAWQRQTLKFGHEEGTKYSALILDNRGMGSSDTPMTRYTTSDMAKDIIELVDYLGWTSERELHVMGVSMGGMIAQELANQIPTRVCSLNLLSTAAAIENTTTFFENLKARLKLFIPTSLDRSVADVTSMAYAEAWLTERDSSPLPKPGTPGVVFPVKGYYGVFGTNYDRVTAEELTKRLDKTKYSRKGFMLQVLAAAWHHKSAPQLSEIGDRVGRERILVLHGTKDNMISLPHGKKLVKMLQPGLEIIKDGIGHVFMTEDAFWFNDMIATQIDNCRSLGIN